MGGKQIGLTTCRSEQPGQRKLLQGRADRAKGADSEDSRNGNGCFDHIMSSSQGTRAVRPACSPDQRGRLMKWLVIMCATSPAVEMPPSTMTGAAGFCVRIWLQRQATSR